MKWKGGKNLLHKSNIVNRSINHISTTMGDSAGSCATTKTKSGNIQQALVQAQLFIMVLVRINTQILSILGRHGRHGHCTPENIVKGAHYSNGTMQGLYLEDVHGPSTNEKARLTSQNSQNTNNPQHNHEISLANEKGKLSKYNSVTLVNWRRHASQHYA